ncbi:hypothetical protein ACIBG0_19730 [Nocardia sp. NPDC050630]|uniref:hypothetical protein n=1 Tax=Nocardia sp. NPDC050630 TaxID=3364321 RepID=UPI00378B3F97
MYEDPDLAQAQVFLELLANRGESLTRELGRAQRLTPAYRAELVVELRAIQRFIDRLHRRFPETCPGRLNGEFQRTTSGAQPRSR